MKFIKFILSDKSVITMDEDQAKELMRSSNQIFPIKEKGEWTGEVINKAFIVRSMVDVEASRDWFRANTPAIEEPEFKPLDLSKFRPNLKNRKVEVNPDYKPKI